jgi:hypothetical protein
MPQTPGMHTTRAAMGTSPSSAASGASPPLLIRPLALVSEAGVMRRSVAALGVLPHGMTCWRGRKRERHPLWGAAGELDDNEDWLAGARLPHTHSCT